MCDAGVIDPTTKAGIALRLQESLRTWQEEARRRGAACHGPMGERAFMCRPDVLALCKEAGFPSVRRALQALGLGDLLLGERNRGLLGFYDRAFDVTGYADGGGPAERPENLTNNWEFNSLDVFVGPNKEKPAEDLLHNNYALHLRSPASPYTVRLFGRFRDSSREEPLLAARVAALLSTCPPASGNARNAADFFRRFVAAAHVHELATMSVPQFNVYAMAKHTLYMELARKSFPDLLKEFTGKGNTLSHMYDTVALLLLGGDANTANTLLAALRERKGGWHAAEVIARNLPCVLQARLKRPPRVRWDGEPACSGAASDAADLKAQLLGNPDIPQRVKDLTADKINEMRLNNNDFYKQQLFVKTVLAYPWAAAASHPAPASPSASGDLLAAMQRRLEASTYGHKKVKEQMLLLMAKWLSNPASSGSALALAGPPGVGKTLIAKSLGEVLDIPFVQITLGGQNDGELLHGHGYTYSGAQPGLIVRKMVEAGRPRCIMYFDELDKSCAKHGTVNEITSILIHLTDPNMSKTFQDRFFQGIDFPLDQVIFMFSFNDRDKVDPILLDRLTEIHVKPYTVEDKVEIARRFIVPELVKGIGLNRGVHVPDDIVRDLVLFHTNEAGVRDLKSKLESVLMHVNKDIMVGARSRFDLTIGPKDVDAVIDPRERQDHDAIHGAPCVGLVNGMFATSHGMGGVLPIEVVPLQTPQKEKLHVTGQLGDVMRESVDVAYTAALSYLEQHAPQGSFTVPHGFHVHFPAGAVPKDGPSAGCAIALAFVSVMTGRKVDNTCAITGEIDIFQKVTKIGGLLYKLTGSQRAGVQTALIPKDNSVEHTAICADYPQIAALKVKNIACLKEAVELCLLS